MATIRNTPRSAALPPQKNGRFPAPSPYYGPYYASTIAPAIQDDLTALSSYTYAKSSRGRGEGVFFAVFLAVSTLLAAEKITWKPVALAVLKVDRQPAKIWNIYVAQKKEHMVLVQLGRRFLMLDMELREVVELDPAMLQRKGKDLQWEREATEARGKGGRAGKQPRGETLLSSEDWNIRDAGPARIVRVRLVAEGRVLEVQLPLRPDLRVLY